MTDHPLLMYPWYKEVNIIDKVTQGDILFEMPVPSIKEVEEPPYYKIGRSNIPKGIVLTQACDLENNKIDQVAICPIVELKSVLKSIISKEMPDADYDKLTGKQLKRKHEIIDEIRQGQYLDYYLMNTYTGIDESLNMSYEVVLLRNTFYLPVSVVNTIISHRNGKRLTLLPPYREHLAQAYARNFNRIGLPIDIKVDVSKV